MNESTLFLQNLMTKKREILIGFASVVSGVAILIGYFQSGPDAMAYAHAEMAFSAWERNREDAALYDKMRRSIKKIPALERKYEAYIAQSLLNSEKTEEAFSIARHCIDRVKNEAPFHAAFAENSLLIERGSYLQALENSIYLKDLMKNAFNWVSLPKDHLIGGSILYAHNLLRIASLQQKLKNQSGEKAAWEEFESFLKTTDKVSDAIQASFSEKNLSLNDYILERKKSF